MPVQFDLVRPGDLSPGEWRGIQTIAHDAYSEELRHRTQDEIDHLTAWAEPERFYESHVDPDSEVGKRYGPNQAFTKPRVALATDGNDTIGFGYGANNVSGTPAQWIVKLLGTSKKYLWLREFAVQPDYQRQGIATDLARILLISGSAHQPVTAYMWPDEIPFLAAPLRKAGFEPTGERKVAIYGPDSEPVRQVRMLSKSVGATVLKLTP